VDKAGALIAADAPLALMTPDHPYVGRGGLKLEGALRAFGVAVAGRVCVDLGASTGGFTDCLLRHGAALVYAVDVGWGLLDARLRGDPRVVVMERRHARTLTPADFPRPPDLATVDLSFISLATVLPVLAPILTGPGEILALLKPQFEVGKGKVGRGGVVRDPSQHREVIARIGRLANRIGLQILGAAPSCLRGPKGNREFFLHLGRQGPGLAPEDAAERAVRGLP
jgi:23S rRNA (cytidine1920-2'-O)/16S rRNA (cytidine1409-2'-O)-methyltransferase